VKHTWTKDEIQLIGDQIGTAIQVSRNIVDAMGLDKEDLAKFEEYLAVQDAVGAVIDPTTYREAIHGQWFEKARERIKVLKALLDLPMVGD
jgi:hypothetical protein